MITNRAVLGGQERALRLKLSRPLGGETANPVAGAVSGDHEFRKS